MRILYSASTSEDIVLLWGCGLIGQAISHALLCRKKRLIEDYAFPWKNKAAQAQAASTIALAVTSKLQGKAMTAKPRLVFVWSAGRAGFSATHEQAAQEMAAFTVVLELARRLQQQLHDVEVEFHLLSSAGGLFEGHTLVGHADVPQPRRPYGQLKQEQEQALLKASQLTPVIYRAASVYGIPSQGRRTSLIPVLIHHGLLRQVVTIVGAAKTLRDYVCVDDVGHYIAQKITCPDVVKPAGGIYWMVTGKPSAIMELTGMVEEVIRRKLYLSYRFDAENSSDITFSPELKPADFSPLMPPLGISWVYRHWQDFI